LDISLERESLHTPGVQVDKVDMSRAVPVPVEDVCSNTDSNNDINSSNDSGSGGTNTREIGEGDCLKTVGKSWTKK
jgi:hypothetical protein